MTSIFNPKTQPVAFTKDVIGNIVYRLEINLTCLERHMKNEGGQLVLADIRRDLERAKSALAELRTEEGVA